MRLSFITQFKIEFLLPFTDCRKVLGKMSGMVRNGCGQSRHSTLKSTSSRKADGIN